MKLADTPFEGEGGGPKDDPPREAQPDIVHVDYSVKCPLHRGEKVKLRALSLGDEEQVTGRVEKIENNTLFVHWETGKYKDEVWKYDLLQPLWQAAIQSMELP